MFKRILLLFIVIVLIGGCKKKYPDDKWLHIYSPYKRLTRSEWNIISATPIYPCLSHPDCMSELQCSFKTDGTSDGGCSRVNIVGTHVSNVSYNYWFRGNWELINNNNKIKITNDAIHFTIWTIKELDRKKMKLVSDSVEVDFD
jgi:hypothetical protein